MSRVHDALRRAEQMLEGGSDGTSPEGDGRALVVKDETALSGAESPVAAVAPPPSRGLMRPESAGIQIDARAFLSRCRTIPFRPAPEAHLINPEEPHDGASEEFRSLRTRLNHMQAQQDLKVIVCTSASPAEGKTFTACNLALAQAQLEAPVLLADFDLRRPVVHQQFQCERTPGFSDFLLGEKSLEECIRRIEGTNLYLLPAGSPVRNPLELLNMRPVRYTLDAFRKVFNWVILDTPPLLFSADANLMATITDGILLVVRIGSTTYDSVVRAIQTLCENNVLGIVANGARAGELYSKYTYYYTKSENLNDEPTGVDEEEESGGTLEELEELAAKKAALKPASEPAGPASEPVVAPRITPIEDGGPEPRATASSMDVEATEPTGSTEENTPVEVAAPKSKGGFFSRFGRSGKPRPEKVKEQPKATPKKSSLPFEEDEDDDE
jgi:receptor protein-tyrosine kinase